MRSWEKLTQLNEEISLAIKARLSRERSTVIFPTLTHFPYLENKNEVIKFSLYCIWYSEQAKGNAANGKVAREEIKSSRRREQEEKVGGVGERGMHDNGFRSADNQFRFRSLLELFFSRCCCYCRCAWPQICITFFWKIHKIIVIILWHAVNKPLGLADEQRVGVACNIWVGKR